MSKTLFGLKTPLETVIEAFAACCEIGDKLTDAKLIVRVQTEYKDTGRLMDLELWQ